MNWGRGIFIVMAGFILFIGTLVYILIGQKVDLVSDEYYKDEISFQGEINARSNGAKMDAAVISQRNGQLVIIMPAAIQSDSTQIYLWRPNDEKLDMKFTSSGTELFFIPLADLKTGRYDVRIEYWKNKQSSVQKSQVLID